MAALNRLISSSNLFPKSLLRPVAARHFNTTSAPPPFSYSYDRQGLQTSYSLIDTEECIHLRVDMPGVEEEGVQVLVKQGQVTLRGERTEEVDTKAKPRTYSITIEMSEHYNLDKINASLKDGVLKAVVPKFKAD